MTLTVQEATLRDYLNTRPPIAGSLLETLREQNGPLTPAQEKNLAALSSGAACVVTGQQLGIFFGPLLTLYKTCAALAYARELESRFSSPVVPIFWMQSEDHDLA